MVQIGAGLLHLRDRPVRAISSGATRKSPARRRTAAAPSWRTRWLLAPRSDVVAAALLGVGDVLPSRPTRADRCRCWCRPCCAGNGGAGSRSAASSAAVAIGLFALNIAVTGEWNYQGGERKTFYGAGGVNFRGGFPYQNDQTTFDTVGLGRDGGGVLIDVLFTRDALLEVFPHNLGYFMFGRHTGFAIYFFPGLMAVLLFLAATRDRAMWQWLTLAAGVGSAVVLLIYMPFTWSGGGGPVGNRYFLGTYGVFLFLVPPLQTAVGGLLAMAMSALFVVADAVESVFRGAQSVRAQQDRPVPLAADGIDDGQRPADQYGTQLAIRQPLGGTPPIFAYFIDDNIYNREGDAFWVRGRIERRHPAARAALQPEADVAGVAGGRARCTSRS